MGPNLVANPGFETGVGTPSNWTFAATSPFLGTSSNWDTTGISAPRSGTHGYEMSNLCSGSLVSDPFPVTDNIQNNKEGAFNPLTDGNSK